MTVQFTPWTGDDWPVEQDFTWVLVRTKLGEYVAKQGRAFFWGKDTLIEAYAIIDGNGAP